MFHDLMYTGNGTVGELFQQLSNGLVGTYVHASTHHISINFDLVLCVLSAEHVIMYTCTYVDPTQSSQ